MYANVKVYSHHRQQCIARSEPATVATRPIPGEETDIPNQHSSGLRVIALAVANSPIQRLLLPNH
jgi:hypothetical protein